MCSISEAPPQQDSQGVGLYLLALALSVLVDIGLWGQVRTQLASPSFPVPQSGWTCRLPDTTEDPSLFRV